MHDFAQAARQAADLAADHLDTVADRPVWQPVPEPDLRWLIGQDIPAIGRPLTNLLADIRDRVLPYPMGNGHPRFFGWVNSPPDPAGVLVAQLAAALNPSCAGGEHAGVLLERTAVRWLAELTGYPHPPGGGLLTSGTSMATIIAVATARQRAATADDWDPRRDGLYGQRPLTMYISSEGHGCLRKAAELLGLGSRHIRTVPVDETFRMDTEALDRMISADADAGLRPFFVAASAGAVNTGAIDPLERIAETARARRLWFHIDGAYGALGTLDPALAPAYTGMAAADSLALDPHKWLGVPADCGCLLFREPHEVRDTFSLVPPYLRDARADELGWFAEYGPEQTRPFRALRLWATIAHLGRTGVTERVQRSIRLAHHLADLLQATPGFELLAPAVTSITAFRYCPPDLPLTQVNALNDALPAVIQQRGRAFLTGTQLGNTTALRACILHPDTSEDDLTALLQEITTTAHLALRRH